MSLFGPFVDKIGPAVPAAYLNALDLIQNAIAADGAGNVTIGQTLTVANGITVKNGLVVQTGALTVDAGITVAQDGIDITSGGLTINVGGGPMLLDSGTASIPSLGFTGDGGVGIYHPANDTIGFSTNGLARFLLTPTGVIQGWSAANAGLVDMSPDVGTFPATLSGFTTTVNITCIYVRMGNFVTLFVPTGTGTSNSTSMAVTGIPTSLQGVHNQRCAVPQFNIEDNTVIGGVDTALICGGAASFPFTHGSGGNTGFTGSGTKGVVQGGFSVTYLLN